MSPTRGTWPPLRSNGLLSKQEVETRGVTPVYPGGNELTWALDRELAAVATSTTSATTLAGLSFNGPDGTTPTARGLPTGLTP